MRVVDGFVAHYVGVDLTGLVVVFGFRVHIEQGQIHLCTEFLDIVSVARHRFPKIPSHSKIIPRKIRLYRNVIHHFEIEWDKQKGALTSRSEFIAPVERGLP